MGLAALPRPAARASAAAVGAGLALGAVLLGATCIPGPPDESRYRFEAYYNVPPERPELSCSFAGGGPVWTTWREGPPEELAEADLARLADESLAWFERSRDAAAWRGNETARLRLVYPSGARAIEAQHDTGAGLAWADQLAEWLGRFPPEVPAAAGADEWQHSWDIELGERGKLSGAAGSEAEALDALRALSTELASWPAFSRATFHLTARSRRSSHQMDVFPVEVESLARLDELPVLLREKRARSRRE